ncbi:MAG: hypothetical protein ABJK83_00280, partial [Parasphingorhabdus sp.]|uniref:hypothetical protein n=1 Tax=Parasphingorhabdus sp. TaxID=2709688 RepID=UPI003298A8CB
DQITEQLSDGYEGSGFERLVGAVDDMMAGKLRGQPLSDRFVQPRGVPVALGVDEARVVIRAVDMTAQAMLNKTGSSADVLSESVTTMREVIGDWLGTGPDPDTVPMHLRPDTVTTDIVRRCVEATSKRLEKEFGAGFRDTIKSVINDFSPAPGNLPASVQPIDPLIVLDPESAEAFVHVIDYPAGAEDLPMAGLSEIADIASEIKNRLESDMPSP